MLEANAVDYETSIPNNVGLSSDRRVLKALEKWHPGYLSWWNEMGPEGFQTPLSTCELRWELSLVDGLSLIMSGCLNIAGVCFLRQKKKTD